ncbi:MAG: Uma2 family endonuclease, partial [Anaerolineae bacterium]|nr:Uma2 family endonuclease [Anaerolineae bacterium]
HFPKAYTGGYLPAPPDLAVEVISATDREANILVMLSTYLSAGTVVWIVYPTTFEVQVHVPYELPLVLSLEDTLTGGNVLPGFSVPVRAFFQPLLTD